MPGNHGEISVDEHNGGVNDNRKTSKKKKKKKNDELENRDHQLAMPKRFVAKIRRKRKSPNCCCSSSPSPSSGSRKGGCFCVARPRTTEDSSVSPPSDPNDESFTPQMLRVMLETNDFCSNDCNPHR